MNRRLLGIGTGILALTMAGTGIATGQENSAQQQGNVRTHLTQATQIADPIYVNAPLLEELVKGTDGNGGVRAIGPYELGQAPDKVGATTILFWDCKDKATMLAFTEYAPNRTNSDEIPSRPMLAAVTVNSPSLTSDLSDGIDHFVWERIDDPNFTYLVQPGSPDFLRLLFRNATQWGTNGPLDVELNNLVLGTDDASAVQRLRGSGQVHLNYKHGDLQCSPQNTFIYQRLLMETLGIDGGDHPLGTVQPYFGPMQDGSPVNEGLFITGYRVDSFVDPVTKVEYHGMGQANRTLVTRLLLGPTKDLGADQALLSVVPEQTDLGGQYMKVWFGGVNRKTGEPTPLFGVDNTGNNNSSLIYLPTLKRIADGLDTDYAPRVGVDRLKQ